MEKTTKITLYSLGGLAVATGLFFAIRALSNPKNDGGLSSSERRELELLRNKDGELTQAEKDRLNEMEGNVTPSDGETNTLGGCSFPLGIGDGCLEIAQMQSAINQKHQNNSAPHIYGYCCSDNKEKLVVDGDLGGKTASALKKYYDICCDCVSDWWTLGINQTCNCQGCKVTKGIYQEIIKDADLSNVVANSDGSFSGFNGYSNFNLPNYGKKYDSPFGDFYKNKLAFTDDYPPQSELNHSYGMGKGFGFSGGSSHLSFNGKKGTESEVQTVQEFFDDVP